MSLVRPRETLRRIVAVAVLAAITTPLTNAALAARVPASEAPVSVVQRANLRLIVIPFTKDGEDIRTILESDFNRQIAVATLKKAFDSRQIQTVDFQAALQAMKRDAAMAALSERDFRDRLLENYKADVYVTVNYRPTVNAGLTSVALVVESFMTANAVSIATATARSRSNREPDVAQHIELAIEEMGPEFLDDVQAKFSSFEKSGVPLAMTVRVAAGGRTRLNQKPTGQLATVADLIEDWAERSAVRDGYSIGQSTDNVLQFTELRVMPRDANGSPATPRRVGSMLASYLETLGVSASVSLTNGALYVDVR